MSDVFREGWTERVIYALTHDGEILNLTGLSVALVGNKSTRGPIAFTGIIGIESEIEGKVYFDPAPDDLVVCGSPFYVRWEVTDGNGKKAYFPRDGTLVWEIQKP